jgi:hypothetical protein
MTASALIAVDWGTSNRRAWRIDRSGAVLDGRQDSEGLLAIQESRFAESLHGLIGDWLAQAPGVPVLMAGMVGSKQAGLRRLIYRHLWSCRRWADACIRLPNWLVRQYRWCPAYVSRPPIVRLM